MRSIEGQGRRVEIHHLANLYVGDPLTWWTGGNGRGEDGLYEDYSHSNSPIVVKIDPTHSKADVAQHLRELADSLERAPQGAVMAGEMIPY